MAYEHPLAVLQPHELGTGKGSVLTIARPGASLRMQLVAGFALPLGMSEGHSGHGLVLQSIDQRGTLCDKSCAHAVQHQHALLRG